MTTEPMTEIRRRLAEPFDPSELKYKPQVINGNRAIAVTYVDARLIQDRPDQVVGVENWQDEYEPLPGGSVLCRLRVKLGKRWITKMDVGSPSEQPDEGDRTKAAVSDALKRAAVKFGIGRYLYRLPVAWVDYDAQKKRIVQPPRLPDWALPKGVTPQPKADRQPPPEPPPPPPPATKAAGGLPATGDELESWLVRFDQAMSVRRFIKPGELLTHVRQAGNAMEFPGSLLKWNAPQVKVGVGLAREFQRTTLEPDADAYREQVKLIYEAGSLGELEAVRDAIRAKGSAGFRPGEWEKLREVFEGRREDIQEAEGRKADEALSRKQVTS